MKLFVLLALVAAASAHDHSTCIPTSVSDDVEPFAPPSVTRVTSAATEIDPSLTLDMSVIQGIIASSPTFLTAESVIESYYHSHGSTVSLLEYYDAYPSAITSPSVENSIESKNPTLASAVSLLVSEEETHPTLSAMQSTFQSLMVAYSTILTAAETAFEFSHVSLQSAESGISKADITSPSAVTDVEVVMSMESVSPTLSSAVSALTEAAEYYSTALRELTTARDWTDTDAWYVDSTLKSIESCYPTLASAIHSIDDFIYTHSSDVSAVSNVVSVLTNVPSIITDVSSFVASVSPSLSSAEYDLSPVEHADTHITTEVTYVDLLEASHPSLSCAESTIERDDVSHASTVSLIEEDLTSPSLVSDTTYVSSLEHLYPSILTAVEEITSVERTHPSFSYVQSCINSAELIDSTVLTDADEVISATSPSLVGDASDLDKIESISPTITEDLQELTTIFEASPSLSCAESVIAQYAETNPSILYTIDEALESPSSVSASSIAYIAQLTAEYPSLASAVHSIVSAESVFPSLCSVQSHISFALTYEPSLISVYQQVSEYNSIVTNEVCSFAPSFSSSS